MVVLARRRTKPTEKERLLSDDLPDVPEAQLILACAKLVARGLFIDEGINRLGIGPLEYLAPTPLAQWFAAWIAWTEIGGSSP